MLARHQKLGQRKGDAKRDTAIVAGLRLEAEAGLAGVAAHETQPTGRATEDLADRLKVCQDERAACGQSLDDRPSMLAQAPQGSQLPLPPFGRQLPGRAPRSKRRSVLQLLHGNAIIPMQAVDEFEEERLGSRTPSSLFERNQPNHPDRLPELYTRTRNPSARHDRLPTGR